ncbi:hypothetical protein Vadar_014361 [Vaccinium darrowii]|uniref:Uncharacterized protein n=1 Tax=Vaccinium darrowii TaxID=229202 RepID=A0ACB7YLS8_9ERIC|nr:hypothetical protein Vadar_014361 [Vaccinium darrowii]
MALIRLEVSKQFYSTSSLVVGYALCSSLLAVINKFAITKFNYPGLLTALQYLTSALGKAAVPFKAYFSFFGHYFGWCCWYVATDSGFMLTAYSWAFAYLIPITSEMVYIKHMVMNLGLNTWGFVFYNNLLSLMMAPLFWIVTGEYVDVFAAVGSRSENLFKFDAFSAVLLSCVFGLLISFFGFAARKAISATAFTVTGVVNKFLTVLINVLIWDKHAGPFGLVCLLLMIGGGVLYQQSVTGAASTAPSQRDSAASKLIDSVNDDGDDKGEEDEEKAISGKISSV